jgi:MinD-like ATPase involved in chromosome partitioning or flagellar assembly
VSRILAVASGKGGTGKTSLSVNLSLGLGRFGRRVCLLDADLGLSNVDVLLGITPSLTLEHVLFEGVPMEQAVIPVAPGVDVVPGGSGVSRLADLPRRQRAAMAAEFAKLSGYDFVVLDNSPGISRQVLSLCQACPELLVVLNPDPTSITDAYALVKVLSENGMRRSPYIVINKVNSQDFARNIFDRVRGAMQKYLKLDARYLGFVPKDTHVSAAVARQRPLIELYPTSSAGRAILGLAKTLDELRQLPGADRVDPAAVMEGALVRMLEALPVRSTAKVDAAVRQTLDAAIALTNQLLENPGQDQGAVVTRLKTLLLQTRVTMEKPGSSKPGTLKIKGVRVAIISSDASIEEILAESLGAVGLVVNTKGGGADAAVVYWPSSEVIPPHCLAALGDLKYVYVRSLTSKDVPRFTRAPSAVMDLPYKLEDLAGAVLRCVTRRA